MLSYQVPNTNRSPLNSPDVQSKHTKTTITHKSWCGVWPYRGIGIAAQNISFYWDLKGYQKTAADFISNRATYTVNLLNFFTTVEIFPSAEMAQLGERQTEDLKVPRSNPENSHE